MHHLRGEQSPKVYEYVGDGAYHSGIPARDLTEDDLAVLEPEHKEMLDNSSLYRSVGPRGKKGEPAEGPKIDDQGYSLEPAPEAPPQDVPVREATGEDAAAEAQAKESGGANDNPPASQNKTGATSRRGSK
jgi:hypothetical protein